MFPRPPIAVLTAVCILSQLAVVIAQSEIVDVDVQLGKPTKSQLRDKQLDVSLETRDIERVLTKLKRASDLAKSRIADAAKMAETASAALEKGDSQNAHSDARQTSEMFKEIIAQLEVLLAEETPQRVAAGRDMAKRLAELEKKFAEEMAIPMNFTGEAKGTPDPESRPQPGMGGAKGERSIPKDKGTQDGQKGKIDPKSNSKPKNETQANTGVSSKPIDPQGNGDESPNPNIQDKPTGNGSSPEAGSEKTASENGAKATTSQLKAGNEKVGSGTSQPRNDESRRDGMTRGATDKKVDENQIRPGGGGGPRKDKSKTEDEYLSTLAGRADELAKMGETLKDVLQAITQSDDPADKEAAASLSAIVKETNLLNALDGMKGAAAIIKSGQQSDARLAALDVADRLEIVAGRLDAAYQSFVAPQVEELRKLEQRLAELREELDNLETPSQIAGWNREIQKAIDEAEKLSISDRAREDLLQQLKSLGGSAAVLDNKWTLIGSRYAAPDSIFRPLRILQEEVQARIQSLLLGDITSGVDEATPPKYQELVDRYYKVLSSDNSRGTKKSEPHSLKPVPKRK